MVNYVISGDGETADLNLTGMIGGWFGVSGAEFADTIKNLASQGTIKRIRVRVNSVGGSIIDGYNIFAAINDVNSGNTIYKGCWVDTYIDGLAASTAGWAGLSGKKVYMLDFAKVGLHNPYSTKENLSDEDKKTLNALRSSIVEIFKNRTNKSEQEISALMNNCTFLTAQQCLEMGLIDEIITTDKNKNEADLEFSSMLEGLNLYQQQQPQPKTIETQTAPLPVQNNNNNNFHQNIHTEMDFSNIAKALNLGDGAKEQDILTAINALKAHESLNKEYAKRIDGLNEENSVLKSKFAEIEMAKCEALVNQAIKDKKVKEADKQTWIDIARNNFELAENTLKTIPVAVESKSNSPRFSQHINNDQQRAAGVPKAMTFMDYLQNDSKELERIKEEEPEYYNQLYKESYGHYPKTK